MNDCVPSEDGPFGTIDDTSLDGGTSSSHGFVQASTLIGTTNILQRNGNADEIVALSYGLGGGFVYYSTIPLDFYLSGSGGIFTNMRNYAANVVAYGNDIR